MRAIPGQDRALKNIREIGGYLMKSHEDGGAVYRLNTGLIIRSDIVNRLLARGALIPVAFDIEGSPLQWRPA
jgi:hypothetical protein